MCEFEQLSVPKTSITLGVLLIGLTVSQCAAELPSHASAREALTSVRLLNDTWNLESNAVLRSEAFADHADQEGYAPIASLFRAAAASQRVHARSLSVAVKKNLASNRKLFSTASW